MSICFSLLVMMEVELVGGYCMKQLANGPYQVIVLLLSCLASDFKTISVKAHSHQVMFFMTPLR